MTNRNMILAAVTVLLMMGLLCSGTTARGEEVWARGGFSNRDLRQSFQQSPQPSSRPAGPSHSLDHVVIPRKTEIFLTLQQTISTKKAGPGNKFSSKTAVPVTFDDRIIIPVGSYVIGHVLASDEPGYIEGKAELLLAFDTIILPEGTTRQIEAVVQSAEGQVTDSSDEQGTLTAPGSQGRETAAGATRGAVWGGVVGAVSSSSLKGLGIGAAIGSGAGALLGLLKKGDGVVLKEGTTLTIQLQNDIRLVSPSPANPFAVPKRR